MRTLNHNLRRWLTIAAICIGTIVLLAIVFRGCVHVNPHKEEKKEVQQINQATQKAWDSTAQELQLSRHREDSLQRITQVQAAQMAATKKELAHSRQKLHQVITALDNAKVAGDTTKYLQLADSLRNETVAQAGVIQHYETLTDSTIENYERRIKEKDHTIEMQADLLTKLRSANIEITGKYNDLHKAYGKVTRKLKGERTMGRILAGAVLVGGLIIAK